MRGHATTAWHENNTSKGHETAPAIRQATTVRYHQCLAWPRPHARAPLTPPQGDVARFRDLFLGSRAASAACTASSRPRHFCGRREGTARPSNTERLGRAKPATAASARTTPGSRCPIQGLGLGSRAASAACTGWSSAPFFCMQANRSRPWAPAGHRSNQSPDKNRRKACTPCISFEGRWPGCTQWEAHRAHLLPPWGGERGCRTTTP